MRLENKAVVDWIRTNSNLNKGQDIRDYDNVEVIMTRGDGSIFSEFMPQFMAAVAQQFDKRLGNEIRVMRIIFDDQRDLFGYGTSA